MQHPEDTPRESAKHVSTKSEIDIGARADLRSLSRPSGILIINTSTRCGAWSIDSPATLKATHNRMALGLEYFMRALRDLEEVGATDPHELMRVVECGFIRDCAEMAARASIYRTESRWGLYHHRLDYPKLDNEDWFVHVNLRKDSQGAMELLKRPVAEYVVPVADDELGAYHRLRVASRP